MQNTTKLLISRRELLKQAVVVTSIATVGVGFIAAPNASWALEVKHIPEHHMATLLQMARDIYPHDRIGDKYYATAIKGYDDRDKQELVATAVTTLDKLAQNAGANNYLNVKWEEDRVSLLKQVENETFFQTIRGGLVTGLYNQKPVWALFGYEGESFSKGGYLNRGFDDIDWL